MTQELNPYDANYLRLMSDDDQDAEPPRYHEGDTPPSVPGVTLEVEADWSDERGGMAGMVRLATFLPTPVRFGEAALVFTLLGMVGAEKLPFLEALRVAEYTATGDLTLIPLWLEGWNGREFSIPRKGDA